MSDIEKIKALIEKALSPIGYCLYKVDYHRSGKEGTLSVIVDRDAPISLDDIVSVTEAISASLDKEDPIEEPYTLDVSSLGAEKPIDPAALGNYIGSYVNLHLTHPYKGENILEGTVEKIEEGTVTLSYLIKGKKTGASFPLKDVDKARLAIKF